jgi:ABC-type Fe3+ transport system permease subunit
MSTSIRRHYRARLLRSERLPYRLARLVLGAIPLLLPALVIAYVLAGR